MIDTLLNDTTAITNHNITESVNSGLNIWLIISIIELIIIIILLTKIILANTKHSDSKTREILDTEIDFGNLVHSSFHSQDLYDKLKIKCHPDRFPNDKELNAKALELFQDISKNKYNYKELLRIKERAESELKIKI